MLSAIIDEYDKLIGGFCCCCWRVCYRYPRWVVLRATRHRQWVRAVVQHPNQERRHRHLLRLASTGRLTARSTRTYSFSLTHSSLALVGPTENAAVENVITSKLLKPWVHILPGWSLFIWDRFVLADTLTVFCFNGFPYTLSILYFPLIHFHALPHFQRPLALLLADC